MFPEGRALEFLIAATVALIVVGPKDLPMLLRKLGQFMAKVRSMAAEFRASFDEMARQSELDELRKEVEAMRKGQLADIAAHTPEMNQAFDEISQGLSDVGVQLNASANYPHVGPEMTVEVKPTAKARSRKAAPAQTTPGKTSHAKATPAKVAPAKAAAKAPAAPKTAAKAETATKPAAKISASKPVAKVPAKAVAPKPRARKAAVS